jgi:hypothetical protein
VHDEMTARLAYEETVRRITGQMQVLDGLRTRAGTLFGAASLATSFLSSVEAKNEGLHLGVPGWIAVCLFAAITLVTMAMFVSVASLSFTIQRKENEDLLARTPTDASPADTYRDFARRLERNFEANSHQMKWYFGGMFVLCSLVGTELILWTLDFVI